MFTDITDPTRQIVTPAQRIRALISRIADEHGVTHEQIMGRRRLYAEACHAAWHALWNDEGWSLTRIGDRFGRDHSTIAYGIGSHILANGLPTNWMSARAMRMRVVATAWNRKKRDTAA